MTPDPARARRDLSYRTRLVLGIGGLVLLTGAAITWLAHRSARQSTEAMTDALFREASAHAVDETRAFTERATPVVEALRHLGVESLTLDDSDKLTRQLLAFLQSNPGLSWVSYSDEAGRFMGAYRSEGQVRIRQTRIVDGKSPTVEYEVMPDGKWRVDRPEMDSAYDPRVRPFYTKAKAANRLVWLPPYIFYDQGVPGISCAAPLADQAGRFLGVLTADFDLNSLSTFVARLSVSPNSRFFMYTADETLLAHPTRRVVTIEHQQSAGRLLTLTDTDDPLVEAFRGRLPADPLPGDAREAFQRFQFDHEGMVYLASTTAFRVGDDQVWVVGAVAPKADFLAEVWRSQAIAVMAATGALLIAVLLAALMARSVSTPVLRLIGFMRRVGAGDLDAKAEFSGSSEFRELSSTLNQMILDLRDGLRLRHSVEVAMQVQQQLLPRGAPTVWGLDVAGHSTYCDETGGDYYDFLVLEQPAKDTLLVVLGDVMGHGVASALVMAGVRSVLRDRIAEAGQLAALLARLNNALSADLEGSRFMTMYLAAIDARARAMRWASAGHDPALVYDPADRGFREDAGGDLPLGVMPDTVYAEQATPPLAAGQVILVGTDGVWEMMNPAGEAYGKDRLRETIRAAAGGSAKDVVRAVLDSLKEFRKDRRPTDDVTFVVIKVTAVGAAGEAVSPAMNGPVATA
ncbi:MAG TPA: SpoIIE family protein phosphatase [Gemmataceae bacterium]|nr:SpoIIE family protein phosphatase [Gemmataceae bacterium]